MTVERLEAELAATVSEAPEAWAQAAYRLALAKSESACKPEDMRRPLEHLDAAAGILTAQRAPVEHARIVTAAANCHRALGNPDRALELFTLAADLLMPRATAAERAGALVNVGLAQCEAGRPESAVDSLNRALADIAAQRGEAPAASAELARLAGAALVNRAQARQRMGDDRHLEAAREDYRAALEALPGESIQAAMAHHGLGAVVLELCKRGAPGHSPDEAVAAFERALAGFAHPGTVFQQAMVRYSLALAFEQRDEPGDAARALNSVHAALSVFDPRLHAALWRTAHAALCRIEASLDAAADDGRAGAVGYAAHVAALLAMTTESEREHLLRDRLLRATVLPAAPMAADVEALISSLATLAPGDYRTVVRTLIGVLMELPEELLEAACAAFCAVHRLDAAGAMLDEELDKAIHGRLFGPQRVRMRDLLEVSGWVRP